MSTTRNITASSAIPALVHVENDSLPEIRTSPSGLANPTASHGAHGRNPGNYPPTEQRRNFRIPATATTAVSHVAVFDKDINKV